MPASAGLSTKSALQGTGIGAAAAIDYTINDDWQPVNRSRPANRKSAKLHRIRRMIFPCLDS